MNYQNNQTFIANLSFENQIPILENINKSHGIVYHIYSIEDGTKNKITGLLDVATTLEEAKSKLISHECIDRQFANNRHLRIKNITTGLWF